METKTNPIETCEFKFDDDEWKITGYASVFNSTDKVGDTILPGAFTKSLETPKEIKMYYEHMRFLKPGKWATFEQDEKGLKVAGYLTRDHSLAKDLRAEMRHGTVKSMSVGFTIPTGGVEEKEDGGRILKVINLVEVSLTGNPAEPKAIIESFKSELNDIESIRELEGLLRDAAGLSRSMATATIGKMKTLVQSDSVTERNQQVQELKSIMDRFDLRTLLKRK